MITRLIFWALILLFIVGLINSSIDLQTIDGNIVITINYLNFIDNSVSTVEGFISFFSELFSSTEETVTQPNPIPSQ